MSTDTVAELEEQLLRTIPGIAPWLTKARDEHGEPPTSEYWLLSFALRPYLENLESIGAYADLTKAWAMLEEIASRGWHNARSQISVLMEELDLCRFYRFMGPLLREEWFDQLTWYPDRKDRETLENTHVDRERYRERWRQEIAAIHGFENLSVERELIIRFKLKREFRITRLSAPEPGGSDWIDSGLLWPVPPPSTRGAA